MNKCVKNSTILRIKYEKEKKKEKREKEGK